MISRHPFGRTGHASTRIIFGSYALSKATKVQADQVLELLLAYGINHIDTAAIYGQAEKWIGPWMGTHRENFFIATKTRRRTYQGAWDDLQRSLDRLKVNYVDLWQMHGLTGPAGWERAMGPDGALQAFLEARDKGLVRFLGVTGHGTKVAGMHLQSLERYDFDSVMLPYSYSLMQNSRYAETFNQLMNLCHQRKVAVQTIKSISRRKWEDRSKTHNTYFYQPLEEQDAIDKSVHWALGLPDSFVITAGDIQILPKMLEAADRFKQPPLDSEMIEMTEKYDIQPIFK